MCALYAVTVSLLLASASGSRHEATERGFGWSATSSLGPLPGCTTPTSAQLETALEAGTSVILCEGHTVTVSTNIDVTGSPTLSAPRGATINLAAGTGTGAGRFTVVGPANKLFIDGSREASTDSRSKAVLFPAFFGKLKNRTATAGKTFPPLVIQGARYVNADTPVLSGGGAVAVDEGGFLGVTEVTFRNNQVDTSGRSSPANWGGGAILCFGFADTTPSTCDITDSVFEGNSVLEFGRGGAILARAGALLRVDHSTLTNNDANQGSGDGGAIAVDANNDTPTYTETNAFLLGNSFTGNAAQDRGGAVAPVRGANVVGVLNTYTGNTANTGGAVGMIGEAGYADLVTPPTSYTEYSGTYSGNSATGPGTNSPETNDVGSGDADPGDLSVFRLVQDVALGTPCADIQFLQRSQASRGTCVDFALRNKMIAKKSKKFGKLKNVTSALFPGKNLTAGKPLFAKPMGGSLLPKVFGRGRG